MIDLHFHSTFSDGTFTPAELVAQADAIGLTALALTDHDGTDGVAPLLAACAALPAERRIEGIPGVEISAEYAHGAMHLLGYFFDVAHAGLQAGLRQIREGRVERNAQILKKLQGLGCSLTWEGVAAHAGSDVVGRPHFAQALVDGGYANSRQKAFERYLARGKSAYVERFRFPPDAAIALIRDAGGVPVLAHPSSLKLSAKAMRRHIGELKKMGLEGLEVYYALHSPEQQGLYAAIARDLDLVGTGGSDFHGTPNMGLSLGRGFGSLNVPDEIVDQLRSRRVNRMAHEAGALGKEFI